MAKRSVICLLPSRPVAEATVAELQREGFSSNDISVLFPDTDTTRDFAHEKHTKAPEGAVVGAGSGATLGGALGLLAGIGAIAIPGVGPLIAAGPLMALLSGAAVGAAVGGIGGALVGLGIPEIEAKRYEGKVKDGNLLISVHTEDAKQVERAKEVLKRAGGTDISTTMEATPPRPSQPEVRAG